MPARAAACDIWGRMAALAVALFLHGGVIALVLHQRAPPIGIEPEGVEVVLEFASATPEPVVTAEPMPVEAAPTALALPVEPPAEPIQEAARAEPVLAVPVASEPDTPVAVPDMATIEPPPAPPSLEPPPTMVAVVSPPAPTIVAENPSPPAARLVAALAVAPAPLPEVAAPLVDRRAPPAAARQPETREATRERPAPRPQIARAETRQRAETGGRSLATPRQAARAEAASAGIAERRSAGPTPTWIAAVRARIVGGQTYPEAARARGETGTVRIAMVIGRGGALAVASLAGGSGSATLDAAALALVRRVSPFPPFTADMTAPTVSIVVPIAYRLRD